MEDNKKNKKPKKNNDKNERSWVVIELLSELIYVLMYVPRILIRLIKDLF